MLVWKEYLQEQHCNETRVREHREQIITYGEKALKYHQVKRGEEPAGGYPLYIALHGGGGVPAKFNDNSWSQMQKYYLPSIHNGFYVVPRGITNTWDLHFQPESYVLYDRLIENMILFEPVNPDKVYLLGYSAGGDGVYQIAPRMADRWAAVNMSAGHPNSVDLQNLACLPIALQAGQNDYLYNRNRVTAEMNDKLDSLAREHPGNYIHTTLVHANKGHAFYDNHPNELPQVVLDNPHKWLTDGTSNTIQCNTNAIRWLNQFVRNPRPELVTWDLRTRAGRKAESFWHNDGHGQQHYWIDIGDHTTETLGVDTIIVALDKEHNMIRVEKAGKYLRLLVDADMLNLERSVNILIEGQIHTVAVRPTHTIQVETVKQRGDPRYIFDASITLIQTSDGWHVTV